MAGIFFVQLPPLDNLIEKFAALAQFCHEVELLLIHENLVKFYDARMIELLQQSYFIHEIVTFDFSFESSAPNLFDGSELTRLPVTTLEDNPEGPFADIFNAFVEVEKLVFAHVNQVREVDLEIAHLVYFQIA